MTSANERLAHRAVAGGAALRILYLGLHPPLDHLTGDAPGYVHRAARLAGGGAIPRTDLFMPAGTHLLISLPMRVFGTGRPGLWAASILWAALSCTYPWFAYRWARGLMSERAAALTAVGCALSPLAIIYGGYFGSELPAIVLLPAALWLVQSLSARARPPIRTAALAGVTVMLLLTVRQQFALNLALAGWPLVTRLRVKAVAVAAGAAALTFGAVVLLAAPPSRVAGSGLPPVLGQNGGLNFFYGHCDARTVHTPQLVFESPVRAQLRTGHDVTFREPASDQRFFYKKGARCITDDPVRAVVLGLRSVADMTATSIPFPPWSDGGAALRIAELANVAFCAVLALLVVAALRRRSVRPSGVLLAHLACAFVVAVAFLGEPRYRVPYDLFGWALLGWWLTDNSRLGRFSSPNSPKKPT